MYQRRAECLLFTLVSELLQKFHTTYFKTIVSVHIYGVRPIYNIVSICRYSDPDGLFWLNLNDQLANSVPSKMMLLQWYIVVWIYVIDIICKYGNFSTANTFVPNLTSDMFSWQTKIYWNFRFKFILAFRS